MGCGGPYVDLREGDDFRRKDYPRVVVLPFEARNEMSPRQAKALRDWVEIHLIMKGFRVIGFAEVDQRVKEAGKAPTKDALFQACRDLGAQGLWTARSGLEVDAEGRREMTIVLRLHDLGTRDWVLEIRGHDNVDPEDDEAAARGVWVTLVEEMIGEIPDLD